MAKKRPYSVGIEYDSCGMRAAKIKSSGTQSKKPPLIEKLHLTEGNFSTDEEIIAGLKKIKSLFSCHANMDVVTCVCGKQTYAGQLSFRDLPDDEMQSALKFEIRKHLPYDITGSVLDYQMMSTKYSQSTDLREFVVGSSSPSVFERTCGLFEKAGLSLSVIDMLPFAAVNAFAMYMQDSEIKVLQNAILSIGPEFSVIVIDGAETTFFTRIIYFNALQYIKTMSFETEETEKTQILNTQCAAFCDEIVRSMAFYESTYHTQSFTTLYCLGSCAHQTLLTHIENKTGLSVQSVHCAKKMNSPVPSDSPGLFDLSIALALRKESDS